MSSKYSFPRVWLNIKSKHQYRTWKNIRPCLDTAIHNHDFVVARKILDNALSSFSDEVVNAARSYSVLYDLELEAKKLDLQKTDRIPLYWARGPKPGNLGDSLNPILLQKLTRTPPLFTEPDQCPLLAIGSIANRIKGRGVVWGSGLLGKNYTINTQAEYLAVRGPNTRSLILNAGGQCPDIYGDPAILTPLVIPKPDSSASRIGIILHYKHEQLKKPGDCKVISVRRASSSDFAEFVQELSECEYIFSSSLHGLILARAYGIPSRRLISEKIPLDGDDMKFADFRSGVQLPAAPPPLLIESIKNFDESSLRQYQVHDDPVYFDAQRLIEVFPYKDRIPATLINKSSKILV